MFFLAENKIEIGWGIVGVICTILCAVGVCVGIVIWKATQTWNKLNHREDIVKEKRDKEEKERSDRLSSEESKVRESLLNRYKEMYDLEKERSAREIKEVLDKLTRLSNDQTSLESRHRQLREDYDKLKDEYSKVVALNIQYQEAKVRDVAEINGLRSELKTLQHQVDVLDPNKPDITK